MKKEDMLKLAEEGAEHIRMKGEQCNFLGLICNMLSLSKSKYKDNEEEALQNFYEILYNIKNNNENILGGGRNIKSQYEEFIDGFLNIVRCSSGFSVNSTFSSLNLNEWEYVLGWMRRIINVNKN